MKKFLTTIPLFFVMILILQGCGPSQDDIIAYNDKIVDEQEKIIGVIQGFYGALDSGAPEQMETAYNDMVKQLNESLTTVKNMGPMTEETKFRDAAIALFEFYKNVAENEYKEVVEIYQKPAEEITTEEMQRLETIDTKFEQGESPLHDAFIKAQEEFATKHDIQLI